MDLGFLLLSHKKIDINIYLLAYIVIFTLKKVMITVKSMNGDIISLEAIDEKEFIELYKKNYIKPKFHPYISIHLFNNDEKDEIKNMLINIHDIAVFLEEDYIKVMKKQLKRKPEWTGNNSDEYHWLSNLTELRKSIIQPLCKNKNPKVIDYIKEYWKIYSEEHEYFYDIKGKNIYNTDEIKIPFGLLFEYGSTSLCGRNMIANKLLSQFIWYSEHEFLENMYFISYGNGGNSPFLLNEDDTILTLIFKFVDSYEINLKTMSKEDRNKLQIEDYNLYFFANKKDSMFPLERIINQIIDHLCLNSNPIAFKKILEWMDKKPFWWYNINLDNLSLNQNEDIIEYLSKNIHLINWDLLTQNSKAIEILKKNPSKIKRSLIFKNSDPFFTTDIIMYLEKKEKIPIEIQTLLFQNKNKDIMHYIENHQEKFDLSYTLKEEEIKIKESFENYKKSRYQSQKPLKDSLSMKNFKILCENPSAFPLLIKLHERGIFLKEIWTNENIFCPSTEFEDIYL